MKKLLIQNKEEIKSSQDLLKILLENRNIKTKKEIEGFLNPKLSSITTNSVKINSVQLKKALVRIKKAIKEKQKIIVYGDYDVDGICSSAILWETLNSLKADARPFIPNRFEEGYGLSEKGIENLKSQAPDLKLIITVDNGIVANEAVDYANKNNIDVIITDHHVPAKKLPNAFAIIHTTLLCGAGVAYMLSKELVRGPVRRFPPASARSRFTDLRAVGNPSSSATPLYSCSDTILPCNVLSSLNAFAASSLLGGLPCHTKSFSMKETPLPGIV